MPLTPVWEVRTTLPTEESAVALARALVESKLAACVQIAFPIRSIYSWKAAIQDEQEWKLSAKTTETVLSLCMAKVDSLHPYDVPEIVADPIGRISESYHQWLIGEVDFQADSTTPRKADISPWHLQIQLFKSNVLPAEQSTDAVLELDALPISFEAISEKISSWPGMYFEMDGSFVWVASQKNESNHPLWQLDGMVYDRNGQVQYIELKGRCDRTSWDKLVAAILSDPEKDYEQLRARLGVHLVQQSSWVLESEFKKSI